jgi:hypothetical protein
MGADIMLSLVWPEVSLWSLLFEVCLLDVRVYESIEILSRADTAKFLSFWLLFVHTFQEIHRHLIFTDD